MLIRPPALATKSGAHRIPRAASRSAIRSSASWLLAAPAIDPAAQAGDRVVVEHAAERARARGYRPRPRAQLGLIHRAPSSSASWRLDSIDVASTSQRPGAAHRLATREPTWPSPITQTVRPRSEPTPNSRSQQARIAGLDAEGGERARVSGAAAAACESGHMTGALRDDAHVPARGADVLGRDVVAVERLDGVAEVQQRGVAALAR